VAAAVMTAEGGSGEKLAATVVLADSVIVVDPEVGPAGEAPVQSANV